MPPPPTVRIRVYDGGTLALDTSCAGPVELGRQQDPTEVPPFASHVADGKTRLVVARLDEKKIPRFAARLETIDASSVRIANPSTATTLGVEGDADLLPGAARDVPLPAVLTIGSRAVRVEAVATAEPERLETLAEATLPPGQSSVGSRFPSLAAGVDGDAIVRWLKAALDVFQSAAGTGEFFDRAARAVVEAVGMDGGRVFLVGDGGAWESAGTPRRGDPPPSRSVLDRVRQEARTFWARPRSLDVHSLADIGAVVAAPILDRDGRVLGALYGDRRAGGKPVIEAEARLVELLAGGVAAGLARQKQERAILAERVRFEQFFPPEIARHLAERPDLLEGRDAEVTVLFADIRGFSAASERLGPAGTVEWVRDVMTELSDCVRAEGGVLVNYVGDEVLAMWGAPEPQPDHAGQACRAALAMQARLPALDARWRDRAGAAVKVGVGVHSGPARVGNIGTPHKFMYGPLGHTVNLASRVQGATKNLQVPVLVTSDTCVRLGAEFARRRLTSVRVRNILQPVELYELSAGTAPGWANLRDGYETALADFEKGRLGPTARGLGVLLEEHPGDGPSLLLLARAVNALLPGAPPPEAVWTLADK